MQRVRLFVVLICGSASVGAAQSADEHASPHKEVERELRQLNQEVADMQVRRDATAAERLLADDYVFLQADGNVSNEAQNVAVIRDPAFVRQSLVTEDVKVRVYGDAAVITGHVVMRATYGGQDVGGEFLYTDVWAKLAGRWQTVVSQATRRPRVP
jgi:ketosteroid isomerase-like protein